MLLLVLILVLVAFGLLVVALLTGSVLCAWLSVAVSVAAAVVLILDWRQRRSAERAGRVGAEVAPGVGQRVDTPGDLRDAGDRDPVTEVLPVIARSGEAAGAATVVSAVPVGAADSRSRAGSDGQRTVTMPSVQPSGSDGRPSGAEGLVTPSDVPSSPRVTEKASNSSSGDPVRPFDDAPRRDAESTVVVDTRKRPGGPSTPPADAASAAPRLEKSTPGQEPDAGPEARVAPSEPASAGSGASRTDEVPESGSGAAAASDDGAVTVVTRPGGGAPPPASGSSVTHSAAVAEESGRGTFGGPVSSSGHDLFDPVDRSGGAQAAAPEATTAAAGPPPVEDGEPPEEQFDPAAARVVATLEDQVLVVDEQPRYHVAGCRALATRSTIPLPAREAVELGFTPCGWCTPDAVLGGQHRAGARP